jgi:hypothetical protein
VIDAVAHQVPVPIVSAVGHEVDRPLVQDLVHRAFATPTALGTWLAAKAIGAIQARDAVALDRRRERETMQRRLKNLTENARVLCLDLQKSESGLRNTQEQFLVLGAAYDVRVLYFSLRSAFWHSFWWPSGSISPSFYPYCKPGGFPWVLDELRIRSWQVTTSRTPSRQRCETSAAARHGCSSSWCIPDKVGLTPHQRKGSWLFVTFGDSGSRKQNCHEQRECSNLEDPC